MEAIDTGYKILKCSFGGFVENDLVQDFPPTLYTVYL